MNDLFNNVLTLPRKKGLLSVRCMRKRLVTVAKQPYDEIPSDSSAESHDVKHW